MVLQKNLHFSIGNFHFSMKFSVAFQNAKLIQNFYSTKGGRWQYFPAQYFTSSKKSP
jgi:hypothetical protein